MSIKLNAVSHRSPTDPIRGSTIEAPADVVSSRLGRLSPVESSLWERLSETEYAVLENPTDPHITHYLDTVKDLLNQALKRHQAKSSTYWSPKGRFRQMVHIVQVNRALDDLLEDIRHRHPATQMARRLDAIRGLLVDLWI